MALPDPAVASTWGGRTIVDRSGATIGACTQIYTDDATGLPEWATARMGNVSPLIPLVDAADDDGTVRVAVDRDTVLRAPDVADRHHLSTDDEARLYRHYGIAFSADGSPTFLPLNGALGPRRADAPASAGARGHDGSGGVQRLIAGIVAGALVGVLAALVLSRRSRRRRIGDG
jgi:hypothetical protein